MKQNLILAFTIMLAYGCTQKSISPLQGCESNNELIVYCGFQNPEDLAITPDNKFLIVAEFGGMAPLAPMTSGSLSFFDLDKKLKIMPVIKFGPNEWGEPSCHRDASIPFGPHGIDLIKRDDGRFQLAVVSHYPYESIEMFQLIQDQDWYLEWKGCINLNEKYYFNDVALDREGNFYATHMFAKDYSLVRLVWNVFMKSNTGLVAYWNKQNGFKELGFTAGSFPNGIALDMANNNLIVNYNLGDKTSLYSLERQQVISEYKHNSPDNVVIRNGYVWVTNHDHGAMDTFKCGDNSNCPLPFSINQLSLKNLAPIASHSFENTNMGVGTVGLVHNHSIWIGSYHSDRLAEARLPLSE